MIIDLEPDQWWGEVPDQRLRMSVAYVEWGGDSVDEDGTVSWVTAHGSRLLPDGGRQRYQALVRADAIAGVIDRTGGFTVADDQDH